MGVYNAEKTIKRCIDSILNQTYENWEFIICNDGSSDGTLNILNEYQKTDSRIKVISNKSNKKLAVSLNRCLKYAKGKYIARMDADDESLPQRLEVEVDFLERHEQVDLVGCNRIIFDEQGEYGIRKVKEYPTRDSPTLNCDKPQMKQLTVEDKIAIWRKIYDNNNVVLNSYVRGKNIIVVDDLYQSGATIWEYAKYLKIMGAKQVYGIVCVKSLRDSDNT